MLALVYTAPRRLELREIPQPELQPDHVVLKVLAAGVCGSDIDGYARENGRRAPGQVMGHEAVGVVVKATGTHADLVGRTTTFTPIISCGLCLECSAGFDNRCNSKTLIGVHLENPGAFAEYVQVPVRNLVPWEANSNVQGALVEPLAVSWHAAESISKKSADRVLVMGAGTIGGLCAFVCRSELGLGVDVYDPLTWKGEWLSSLGVRNLDRLPPTSETEGYASIIDCVGSAQSLMAAVDLVRGGGQIHVVGMAAPVVDLHVQKAIAKEVTFTTSYAYPRRTFERVADAAHRLTDLPSQLSLTTCTLEEAAGSIETLLDPASQVRKLVICP